MRRSNDFSEVAGSAIERIRDLATRFVDRRLPREAMDSLSAELECHRQTLEQAFEFRKIHGPARSGADSDVYFREKLGAMIDSAKMAIDPELRGGFTGEKILENLDHYAYLTEDLVGAVWHSKTAQTLKESSFDNRDALKRLANR